MDDSSILIDKENANAFVLSTISNEIAPSSRVVLMRGFSEKGLVFYTNYNSQKSTEIMSNNNVSANFFWPQLEKQIRITENAEKISKEESDKYFNSRPLESKIGAIISNQSSTISLDHDFEKEKEKLQSQSKLTHLKDQKIGEVLLLKLIILNFGRVDHQDYMTDYVIHLKIING